MIFQLKRAIARWLFPDLLEELTSKNKEIEDLKKEVLRGAEDLVKERVNSASKFSK